MVRPDSSDCFYNDLGEVGIDGAGTVPEARPNPTPDPAELYGRIKALALEWERRTGLRVCLSGHTHAIGAHIHVGAPQGFVLEGDFQDFVEAIDRRVGFLLVLSGRARGVYRQRRAWRSQPHGLEYRTLPSAVLAFEDLAVWAISSIAAIARGEDPPRRTRRLYDLFKAILEAERAEYPFSFDLEDLRSIPPRYRIELSDEWSSEWREWVNRLNTSGRVVRDVVLFGLAESRGLVTNDRSIATWRGWEFLNFEYPHSRGRLAIGIPREARIAWDDDMARLLEMRLIQLGCLRE